MSSGISAHNATLESIFDPYQAGTTQAASTGINGGGSELSTQFANIIYGSAAAATGIKAPLGDLNVYYAAKGTASYTLPINGNTYGMAYTIPNGATATSKIQFSVSTSGWSIQGVTPAGTTNPNSGPSPYSGSLPSGASSVRYTFGASYTPTGDVDAGGSNSNPAASATAISGTALVAYYQTASAGSASGSRGRGYAFKIEFLNAGGTVISTTNINMQAETDGSV